jgi:MATE family multidrug resistance protein
MSAYSQTIRQTLSLAWPVSLRFLVTNLMTFIIVVILSFMGHQVLAASNLITSAQIAATVIANSLLFGLANNIAHAIAKGDEKKAGVFLQHGTLLGMAIMLPFAVAMLFAKPVFIAWGQPPALAAIAASYLQPMALGMFLYSIGNVNQQFMSVVGGQWPAFWFITMNAVFMILCGVGFGLGKFGLHAYGPQGVAWSAVASSVLGLIMQYSWMLRRSVRVRFAICQRFTFMWHVMRDILKLGFPIMVQLGGELGFMLMLTVWMGWLGSVPLAATHIINEYGFMVIVPLFGLSQAAGILIARAFGQQDRAEVHRLGVVNIGLVLMAVCVVVLCYLVFPSQLASVFVHQGHGVLGTQTLHLAESLFVVFAAVQFFDGFRIVIAGMLRGLFESLFPMAASLSVMWLICAPLGYYLAFHKHLGPQGILYGCIVGYALGAIALIWRWFWKMKQCRQSLPSSS